MHKHTDKSPTHQAPEGITAAGNWIVDRVKRVDRLPGRGMLANVRSESLSTGGAAANVLMDLARLRAPFPLRGIGVVGRDPDGEFVRRRAADFGIDMSGVLAVDDAPTSYTDVMTEEGSGDRTFFHCRGANALFGPEHVSVESLGCRIFHLGYLLLLDQMDEPDARDGTAAAGVLRRVREQGIRTSVDVVSEEGSRFARIVPPALRHTDYLILNEIEAGRIAGIPARSGDGTLDGAAVRRAAAELYRFGDMAAVAIHMPEGAYVRDRAGLEFSIGSRRLPEGFIVGATGAGDAFCAGMLLALHDEWDLARAAEFGIACATACLTHDSATDGLRPLPECLALAAEFPRRPPPVIG